MNKELKHAIILAIQIFAGADLHKMPEEDRHFVCEFGKRYGEIELSEHPSIYKHHELIKQYASKILSANIREIVDCFG